MKGRRRGQQGIRRATVTEETTSFGPAGASDEALIAAIAGAGDRAAFAELFRRHAGRVKGFLIRAGAPADEAEEAAQEVMVTLWRRAKTFDPAKAGAATWIYTIARNRRIDMARRAGRRRLNPGEPALEPEPAPGAERAMGAESRDSRLRAAVATLPADQLEVVRLAFFLGLTHPEIAERLGAPLGTVKSRLRLAFARLREHLGSEFREELFDD